MSEVLNDEKENQVLFGHVWHRVKPVLAAFIEPIALVQPCAAILQHNQAVFGSVRHEGVIQLLQVNAEMGIAGTTQMLLVM